VLRTFINAAAALMIAGFAVPFAMAPASAAERVIVYGDEPVQENY
jgi:hypothetical protein